MASKRTKKKGAATKKVSPKRVEVHRFEKPPAHRGRALPIEVDPRRVEEAVAKIKDELVHWANKGRFTKVRFKFRGKQLLPDIPLAAVVAAEGLTFYWGGILRALLFNLAGKTVLDVELVNDSEKRIQKGKEAILSGEVEAALALFREAAAMDRDNPAAHLNLGVALKLKGELSAAREAMERAKSLDPEGPVGAEAERLLSSMQVSEGALAGTR
ncbi:MAG: tetratricopeptide repeat protein [Myxococcota bacterium]